MFDGLKAVFIGIFATPDLQSADRHRRRAQGASRTSSASCRPGMEAAIAYDATKFINASIAEVQIDPARGGG